ncbi:MAG: LPS-assembly protein LptD, partial [Bacteroidaceae bacterium]|nr:LPS-assembly protein LptD [Bacteroidaceae bacterium]
MKARLLSILTACYVLAALAARPSGRLPFLKSDTDSLLGDSIPLRAYTILPDTLEQDTVPVDTTPKSKNALDMPVNYSAEDSITFDYLNSRAHLYGASKVKYQNLELEADIINISIDSSLVHAISRTDSLGNVTGKPIFRQGTDEYEPDSISYNFKSRKAYISNVY